MAKSLCHCGYEVEAIIFSSKLFTKYEFYIYINENIGVKMKSSFTQLKEIIKSQYPENTFTEFELEEATKNLIKFFTIGAKMAYNCKKNEEKSK